MEEAYLELIAEFHRGNHRQGPGSDEMTTQALEALDVDNRADMHVLDIGCGTGAQTLVLAQLLKGRITAVDMIPQFLDELRERCRTENVLNKVTVMQASMESLNFPSESIDLIWSEGAVYNIGLIKGFSLWRNFLKPGAPIAVSDLSWLTDERPKEVHDYWMKQYPYIDTIADNIKRIEAHGYSVAGHFILPKTCWLDNYFTPALEGSAVFLDKHRHDDRAREIVAGMKEEMSFYEKYRSCFGYVFYLARRT